MVLRGMIREAKKKPPKKIKTLPIAVGVCGKSLYKVGLVLLDKNFEKRSIIGETLVGALSDEMSPIFDSINPEREEFYIAKYSPKTKKINERTLVIISITPDLEIETSRPIRSDDFIKSITINSSGCLVLLK